MQPIPLENCVGELRITFDGKLILVPKDVKPRSCFSGFFTHENGVISLSLKSMTLTGALTSTFALFYMLYIACRDTLIDPLNPSDNCSFRWHHPMVSDVICLPFFDWIWCILSTFFALTVMLNNIRAFHRRFHGVISVDDNFNMLCWGAVICVTYPLIGYFDEWNYTTIHFTVALIFFVCTTIYCHKLANRFFEHWDKFPHLSNNVIWFMKW